MTKEQEKPVRVPVKKFVINPDRLPERFPHHLIIYWILVFYISGSKWNWVVIIMTVIVAVGFLLYLHRKSIEIPNKTN